MHEAEILAFIQAQASTEHAHLGIGDDCCIWQANGEQCLSSDAIIEGSHFTKDMDPKLIGRKAAAAALSDMAAMGAEVIGASLVYQFSDDWNHEEILSGFCKELKRHQCPLLGGDTVRAPVLGLSVTVWGKPGPAQRLLRRSGASTGDLLVVTGLLGGSFKSGRHLCPEPRILEGQWLAQQKTVFAMMDISDGLAADVPRLAAASGCGSLIFANNLPIHDDVPANADEKKSAMCDGEDFELLIAVDALKWPQLSTDWPFQIPLTMVGMLTGEVNEHLYEDEFGSIGITPFSGFTH